MKEALRAKEQAKSILRGFSGVNGVGIAWTDGGEPCVRINVDDSFSEQDRSRVPLEILGVPVEIRTIKRPFLEPLVSRGR